MRSTMALPNHAACPHASAARNATSGGGRWPPPRRGRPRDPLAGRGGGRLLADCDGMDGLFEAVVDLAAIRSNVARLASYAGGAQVMAVVKSDGYGHGMIATAAAALDGGATWLGAGLLSEAVELRQAGFTAPVLCLFTTPSVPHRQAIDLGIDLSAGSVSLVRQIAAAARQAGRPARLHLKSEEHTSELQSPVHLVCRLLLEKKKKDRIETDPRTKQMPDQKS